MKTQIKKLLAVSISTVMILSSFQAFAENTDMSMFIDKYIDIDAAAKVEIPDETDLGNIDEDVLENPSVLEEETETTETLTPEIPDKSQFQDIPVWNDDKTLDWNEEFLSPTELNADNIASGKCGDNLTWSFDSATNTLTISGTGDMWDFEVLFNSSGTTVTKNTVPWNSHRTSIKNVIIQEGVTSIGENAFGNYYSGGVNSNIYRNITLPKSLKKIGPWAFSYAGLESITLSENLEIIDLYAFQDCRNLTNIYIPNSVTRIDESFFNCTRLKTITVDNVQGVPTSKSWGVTNVTVTYLREMNISSIPNQTYTGNQITPDVVITADRIDGSNSKQLTKDMDYILTYSNNINTGTATVDVKYKENYSGYDGDAKNKTFTILSKNIGELEIEAIPNQIYTGSVVTPELHITYEGKTLVKDIDYTLSYSNNIKVGTATVIVTGKGNFNGTVTNPFSIVGIDISGAAVDLLEDISYQGEPCCPDLTVVNEGKTLTKDIDYTVSYSNNNGVGTAAATITGTGNYTGIKTVEFEIGPFKPQVGRNPIDINNRVVEVSKDMACTYNGKVKEPKPTLIYTFVNETTGVEIPYDMQEGKDYEIIAYENNINAGTAKIIIEGINAFKNTREITFTISPCELSDTEIADIPSAEYCKEDICPEPEIRIGDKVLEKDVDYTLEYENNRNRGTASVVITGKGNLTGTITKNFEITPRDGTRFTIIVWL